MGFQGVCYTCCVGDQYHYKYMDYGTEKYHFVMQYITGGAIEARAQWSEAREWCLLVSPNQIHRRRVSVSSRKDIIHDSKKHDTTKHDNIPVHAGGSDRGSDWEENEDPDHKEEGNGSDVDGKTKTSKRPTTGGEISFC